MPKPFVIYKDEIGEYRVKMVAANGKILNSSEGFKRRRSAYTNIFATVGVMKTATKDWIVDNLIDDQTQ